MKFTLHLDVDNAAFTGELDRLKQAFAEFPNMVVSELRDEPFFFKFLTDNETVVPYRYFRSGTGQNLAAASDILRYRLIHEYGGLYMDCDDVMVGAFEDAELNAGPDDVLTGGAVSSPRMGFTAQVTAILRVTPVIRSCRRSSRRPIVVGSMRSTHCGSWKVPAG